LSSSSRASLLDNRGLPFHASVGEVAPLFSGKFCCLAFIDTMGASDSRRCGHGTSACALYPAPGAPPRRRRVSRVPGPCFEDVPPLITTAAPTTSFSRCSAADGRLPHLRAGSPAATVFSGPPRVRLRYGPSPVLTLTGLCQAAWYFGLPLHTCLRLRGEREIAAVGTSQPTSMVRVWLGAPGVRQFIGKR